MNPNFYLTISLFFLLFSLASCRKVLPIEAIQQLEEFVAVDSDFLTKYFYSNNSNVRDISIHVETPKLTRVIPVDSVNAFPDIHVEGSIIHLVYRSSNRHVYGKDGTVIYELYDTSFKFIHRVALFSENGLDCRDPKIIRLGGDTISVYFHSYLRYATDQIIRKRKFVMKYLSIKTGELLGEFSFSGEFDEIPWHWHLVRDPVDLRIFHSWGYTRTNFSRDQIIPTADTFIKGKNLIDIGGFPGEARTRFNVNQHGVSLVRRPSGSFFSVLNNDSLHIIPLELGEIGGPNFLFLNQRVIVFCGRIRGGARLYKFDLFRRRVSHVMDFPSKGDMGYFGMGVTGNTLFLAYYSSHEERITKVFLTKVFFSELL